MFKSLVKNKSAFTLIELLVVIAIIGILSTLAIVALGDARVKARDAKRITDVKQIATALELYFIDNGSYPSAITSGESITDENMTYMAIVPSNPKPRNDGTCSNTNYVYSTQNNNTSYTIYFCLGGSVANVGSGNNQLTPPGIITTAAPILEDCGNGTLDPGEGCDDGNISNSDDCLNNCTIANCGDGYVWSGQEDCDDADGDGNDYCVECVAASCGDGYVYSNLSHQIEACDDGNTVLGDGCTDICSLDSCGDSEINMGEECDDGNGDNTDDCTSQCYDARCGDGYLQAGEECDDGNDLNTDSCTNSCINN